MALWNKISARGNVDDRRGAAPRLVGGGLTGLLLVMGVTYLMGGNPLQVLLQADPSQFQIPTPTDSTKYAGADEYEVFVSTVLGSTNTFWEQQFATQNRTYVAPKLVLFRSETNSACGGAYTESGPHYCPLDSTIYLDETFFEDIKAKLETQGGDVAEAYVIGHEVGHHVQDLLGHLSESNTSNEASIQTELQADCYAGLWVSSLNTEGVLLPGEISEALDTASAVGDDRVQAHTSGHINPETWTHGSAEERVKAFTTGYTTGEFSKCNL